MMQLTEARWSPSVRRLAVTTIGFLPVSFVLLALLFTGRTVLYPWTTQPIAVKAAWLNVPFFFGRQLVLSLALFAACLAVVTLMGHRLHTEEVVLQTQTADGWAYYQAKNTRSQMYAADAKLAELQGPQGTTLAATWIDKANQERQQADDIRRSTEDLEHETQTAARRATMFDAAEVFIEIAMVLCSVSLLTSASVFWRVSFVSTGVGLVLAALGFLKR